MPTNDTSMRFSVLIHNMPSKIPQKATMVKSPKTELNGCKTALNGSVKNPHNPESNFSKQNVFVGAGINLVKP
jgi:hypothetical protein